MKLRASVNDRNVTKKIYQAIRDGADRGGKETAEDAIDAAQTRLESTGAVWKWEVHEGFYTQASRSGRTWQYVVRNRAPHADYVDEGVSGTNRRRDTPYSFTDRGPPIEALLPWFLEKLW
jgi:hypothetical protein